MTLHTIFLAFVALVAIVLTVMAIRDWIGRADSELQAHVDEALDLGNSGRQP